MEKAYAFLGLKLVSFGIWIMEQGPHGTLDTKDKENLEKLWKLHGEFSEALK